MRFLAILAVTVERQRSGSAWRRVRRGAEAGARPVCRQARRPGRHRRRSRIAPAARARAPGRPRLLLRDPDLVRSQDPLTYQAGFRDYLLVRYSGIRFDVVIAMQQTALDFVEANRDELFPETPIVFVSDDRPAAGRRQRNRDSRPSPAWAPRSTSPRPCSPTPSRCSSSPARQAPTRPTRSWRASNSSPSKPALP